MQTQPVNNPITKTASKNSISFKGYKDIIDNRGREFLEFYAPAYDRNKYSLSLKTISIEPDKKSNWVPVKDEKPLEYSKSSAAFEKDGVFYVSKNFLTGRGALSKDSRGNETGLGYQFVLTPKGGGNSFAVQESGVKTLDGQYNVISANNGITSRSGTMYHAFLNSLYPSKAAKDAKATRTHFNDFGTTIQGVRELLKTGVLDAYSYILSTPLTGKMHGYWSENLFQVSHTLGTMEDFKDLQGDLFDKGLSWVNDGTFTSQGLKCPQFQDVLKYGKESPYYNWFRMGNDKIEIGLLPAAVTDPLSGRKNEGRKHVKYAIINAPGKEGYKRDKATYIQLYDDRLVDGKPTDVIENYTKFNTEDNYEIKEHQDSIVPYYFEIDPKKADIKGLLQQEDKPISDIENLKMLFDFGEFAIVDKKNAKGMNNFDGNTDIVKMNLSNPNATDASNQIGSVQARNFLYQIASYWTKTSADAILEHNVKNLVKDKDETIKKASSAFGVDLSGVAQNVEEGKYNSHFLESIEGQTSSEFLLDQVAQYPLEAIEFRHDLSATLGSPYVTMRPVILGDQGLTRYDMVNENYTTKDIYGNTVQTRTSYGNYMAQELPEEEAKVLKAFLPTSEKMNSIYRNQITQFVRSTLVEMNNINKEKGSAGEENAIFKDSLNKELTSYGKYVAKIITPEIVKFAIVSSLFGNDSIKLDKKTGKIEYNYENLRNQGLAELGISQDRPEQSAKEVVQKIADGMKINLEGTYDKSLASLFANRLNGTTLKNFELSEAMMQQTKTGLNWRFDALKDIGDLESRRNYTISFENCWDDVIDFWSNFMKSVKKENPASYSIAEITDIDNYDSGAYKMSNGIEGFEGNDFGKYVDEKTATRVLLEKTGITTTTNYSYLYKPIVWLFGQWFEDGTSYDKPGMTENLKNSFEEFLKSGPLTAINASHNMISNQDKPRPLHLLSLNVKLFTKGNPDASDMGVVVDVVGAENKNNILSSKAIAVGQIFNRYFDGNNDIPEDTKKYLRRAVAILALGKTTESKDEKTDFMRADTFGAKDFSITLNDVAKKAVEVAKKEGKELTFKEDSSDLNLAESANREIFVDRAYEKITETARGKFAKIWKMYIGLGGNPSLFNGDEYAQTGFESPAKNHHGSNREIVNHDVVKNPRRADTAEYNREIKAVNELHKHKELSALADGTPSSLGLLIDNRGTRVGHTVYKNNDKGSEVLTVNTTVGMVSDWFEQISKNPAPIYLDKLHLGLKGGLTVGTRFKKLSYDKDKGEYVTAQDKYYLNEGNSPEPKYFGTEEEYVVKCNQGGDKYYLERIVHDKDGYHHSKEVELDDSTVIFYKPKAEGNSGTISFKGNPHVSLANLKYNIPV